MIYLATLVCEAPISVHGNSHKFTENREKLVTWSDEHKGRTVRLWQYTPGGVELQVLGSFTPDLRVSSIHPLVLNIMINIYYQLDNFK